MSPLQRAVYWRLSLVYLLTPLLFFLDIFTVAIFATTCRLPGNGSEFRTADVNQSRPADELDSVCAWTEWLSYSQTLFMVGMLLGSLFGGAISDRYGKRPMLLVCLCVQAGCGPAPAALPHPLFFLAVRCLTGLCCCCINISSFSLAVEWTLPSGRLWSSAFLPFCFSLGTMGLAPLAWLSSTWTTLHLALGLPLLVCLPLFFNIPESPHWLLMKKKAELLEGYRQNSAADEQCIDLLLDSAWTDMQKAADAKLVLQDQGHTASDTVLLKHPTILLRLFILSYLSAVSALTYYGICMNVGSFGVDVYSAQFFSGLSETPCLLIPLVCLGRRALSILTLLLSGALCFLSLLLSMVHAPPEITMTLALLGKLCILAFTFVSVLYSIELFPTVVRQRCVALVNLSFRMGCLVNSLVPSNSNGAISLAAMLVYSSGPLLGCALCLFLPETSTTPLPDSVEECERQPRPRLPTLRAILWPSRTGKVVANPAEEKAITHSGFI